MSRAVVVSIVTPTLDAERYLESCLASVAEQQIVELEHIVVDGGSTDRTLEIASRYQHVEVLRRDRTNQSEAINAGLRHARGEVVTWLNADDAYVPGALAFVVETLQQHPGIDVLYGDCQVIGPEGERLWWERPGPYDFRKLLRDGNYLAQPSLFLRRRVFERIGYLDESLEYGMDFDLWLRLRGLRVEYTPRTLACFRWHPDSKSCGSPLENWHALMHILRKHGGGWTPRLAWAFARCLISTGRIRLGASMTGSIPLRPLTRGT